MDFPVEECEMRQVYCRELIRLAERDRRIVLVEADLMRANGTMPFHDRFPERTFDVGVAEANMIGVAAGLAACGKIPFANTFGAFAARRCYDQIAISVAYTGFRVRIGGIDPGVSAETNGGTHMALEDATLMRALPGMTVVEPVDSAQLAQILPQIIDVPGPCYIRLYRKKAPKVFSDSHRFTLGKADVLRDGNDVAIFATGLLLHKSLQAAVELASIGVNAAVVNIHTLKPLDVECVAAFAKRCGAVVTAENHSMNGALGGAVCETLAGVCPVPVVRVGVADRFGEVGPMAYLYQAFGIDVPDVVEAAKKAIACKAS